jgi:hypothetical protein
MEPQVNKVVFKCNSNKSVRHQAGSVTVGIVLEIDDECHSADRCTVLAQNVTILSHLNTVLLGKSYLEFVNCRCFIG